MMIASRNGMITFGKRLDFTLFRGLIDGSISGDITVDMLDGITSIRTPRSGSCFTGCANITSIHIPTSCTSIASYGFSYCSNLALAIIPGSVKLLPDHLFHYCKKLTSVVLGEGITGFTGATGGGWVFEACTNLKQVVFPDSIIDYTSYQCFQSAGVTHVVFGQGCASINSKFFGNTNKVTDITFRGLTLAEVQAMTDYPWGLNQYTGRTVTFHCTDGDFTFSTSDLIPVSSSSTNGGDNLLKLWFEAFYAEPSEEKEAA